MVKDVCSYCGKDLKGLPFVCRYCGKKFCVEHQLPENHDCGGLKKWKRGELKKFKKPIGPRKWYQRKKYVFAIIVILLIIISLIIVSFL